MTAILDFEFVTRDARMIDMAVMLARLIGSHIYYAHPHGSGLCCPSS